MNRAKVFSVAAMTALILSSPLLWAQTAPATDTEAPNPNRGWEGLAEVLDVITPDIDTENPPTGAQINSEIAEQLNRDQARAAFEKIKQREEVLDSIGGPGTDVQLMFQKARALAQLGRINEAQAVYQDMTVRFPELAEPWNNLAVLHIKQGSLGQAQQALETAVMNNPAYAAARSNLADLRLLMALNDYQAAARLGASKAKQRANDLESFIGSLN